MDKKTTRATIGIATLGGLIALGYMYKKHNSINDGLNRVDRRVKRNIDKRKHNILRWKDNKTQDALIKAEKVVKDLQDKTISVRDIAW